MLELYTFLEGHRAELVEELSERIPRVVPVYLKVPRAELTKSLDSLFEAFGDYLVTGEPDTMTSVLKYITRVRVQQSFKLSDVTRALLLILPALRERMAQGDADDEAMQQLEDAHANLVCLFIDIFQEYLLNTVNEHQDYLKKANQKYGLDMSKFILFKG